VLENQGLLAIDFFQVTGLIVLLVLFLLLRRDQPGGYFRLWLVGWVCLTGLGPFWSLGWFCGKGRIFTWLPLQRK